MLICFIEAIYTSYQVKTESAFPKLICRLMSRFGERSLRGQADGGIFLDIGEGRAYEGAYLFNSQEEFTLPSRLSIFHYSNYP